MNINAEISILGALLVRPELVEDLVIQENDFEDSEKGKVFGAIKKLVWQGEDCTEYSLSRGWPELQPTIQEASLALVDVGIKALEAEVMEKSQRRRLKNLARVIISDGPVERLVAEVDTAALDLHGSGVSQYKDLGSHIPKYVENLQRAMKEKRPAVGIPTGIQSLDNIISGLVDGEMTVIGARPSVGKTAISLQLMLNQAASGVRPGMFSLEMDTNPSLMHRMVANRAGVDSIRIRTGHLAQSQTIKVTEALDWLGTRGIFVNDSPKLGIDQIIAEGRRMVRREKVGVIYIDYAGLIRHPDKRLERHEQVADISARIKGMARELKIPVILLSQLTRDTQGKKPTLANLRESGALEQDADAVYLLHKERDDGDTRIVNVDVAKNRNGSIGETQLKFIPALSRFEEVDQ